MAERWRHERENLSELSENDDGVQRGKVDRWWYGERDHPQRDDPEIWVQASRGPGFDWTYRVEDSWNLSDPEQYGTRGDAVEDARERVGLYRGELD